MRRISISTIAAGLTFMLMMSCSDDSNPVKKTAGSPPLLAVITLASDYSAGNFDIVSHDSTVTSNLLDGLHTDLAMRAFGSSVYIIERFGKDNIIKYNTTPMKPAYQQNLGAGLNLQDIAVASETKAYVSAYEDNNLIIFDPSAGKKTSAIDMSQFVAYAGTDSAEAYAYISSLAIYGNYLYAACQRLKVVDGAWGPAPEPGDTSVIAVIDTKTDKIVDQIKLHKKNPATLSVFGDKMLVASSGSWFDMTSGGVELINLQSNTNLGVITEGAEFGGSVSSATFVSANKAFVAVMQDDWTTGIVPITISQTTGTAGAKVAGIEDGSGGMAFDGEKLYVGDRGYTSAGVAVVNPFTDAVEHLFQTSMPPAGVAVVQSK